MIACTLIKPTFVNANMSTPYFNKRVEALYLRDLCMSYLLEKYLEQEHSTIPIKFVHESGSSVT